MLTDGEDVHLHSSHPGERAAFSPQGHRGQWDTEGATVRQDGWGRAQTCNQIPFQSEFYPQANPL